MKARLFIAMLMVSVCAGLLFAGRSPSGGYALTSIEAQNIIYLRQEEKLARDVYLAMLDVYDAQIFTNISLSEQRHMDAVKNLIVKYKLQDPVADDTPGVFPEGSVMGPLYTSLVEKGSTSFIDALEVGVIIEEMDIHDIEVEMLPFTNKLDVKQVFTNLLAGSYNHLEAFNNNLAALGI